MQTITPATIQEAADAIRDCQTIHFRGGGTKTALHHLSDDVAELCTSRLQGISEYEPSEFTFTAFGGTSIRDIQSKLAENGQYLPFDPPLAQSGATLGGTVAAGMNGSCRVRYGGLRDFILGCKFVDGLGNVVKAGGKVVKNAAGFDIPKLMVGTCGSLGLLAEITMKVFPQPVERLTLSFEFGSFRDSLNAVVALSREPYDLEAVDVLDNTMLVVRLAGETAALKPHANRIRKTVGLAGEEFHGDDEAAIWRESAEFTWAAPGATLIRIPLTPKKSLLLQEAIASLPSQVRYTIVGNLAQVAVIGDEHLRNLDSILRRLGMAGQPILGSQHCQMLGEIGGKKFSEPIRASLDPNSRFR